MGNMGYLALANSGGMWVACILPVGILMIMCVIFFKKAMSAGQEMGMTRVTLMAGLNGALISSIGPSLAIVIGMLALVVNMGAPFAWLRLSYIGSLMYELMMADFGARAVGTTLGAANYSQLAFASGVWTETVCALGWMVVAAIATPHLETLRKKLAGEDMSFLPILTSACMLGAFAYFGASKVLAGHGSTVAWIAGAACMVVILLISRKLKKTWIAEWSLGVAMLIAMCIGALV